MKKNTIFCLLLCISFPLSAWTASSPMVEHHIFSPEPDMKGQYKTPKALKLEKELLFTGVIISDQGRWAMVREKEKTKNDKGSSLRKVGDEINGMVIKEIGTNFLILVGDGNEVRLNLYYEGKLRPASATDPEFVSTTREPSPVQAPVPFPESMGPATAGRKSGGSFSEAEGRPIQGVQKKDVFPPADKPFMPDMPPGSFSPDMPDTPSRSAQYGALPQTGPNPVQQYPPPSPSPNDMLPQPPQ